jgi:hypothetical protein
MSQRLMDAGLRRLVRERAGTQAPTPPQRLEALLIFFLPAARLHVPFKFLTPGRGVLLNAVFAQQCPGNARLAPLRLRR